MPPLVVTLTPVAVSDDADPVTTRPAAPLALGVIWAPVTCAEPPAATSIALALRPVVVMTVGPIWLAPIIVLPPFTLTAPKASVPAVAIEPPAIVVDPPVEVMTPYI